MIKKESKEYQSRKRLPMPKYLFADRLKAEMKKKGYTQDKLADLMGVSKNTVYDWCQHYTFPSDMNLGQLCIIFAPCSADYFHGTIDAPNYDIKFVMEYTGLSQETVQYLHGLKAKPAEVKLPRFGPSDYTEEKEGTRVRHIGQLADTFEVNRVKILDKLLRNDDFTKILDELSKLDAATDEQRISELNEAFTAADKMLHESRSGQDIIQKINQRNNLISIGREHDTTAKLAKVNAAALFTNLVNSIWKE